MTDKSSRCPEQASINAQPDLTDDERQVISELCRHVEQFIGDRCGLVTDPALRAFKHGLLMGFITFSDLYSPLFMSRLRSEFDQISADQPDQSEGITQNSSSHAEINIESVTQTPAAPQAQSVSVEVAQPAPSGQQSFDDDGATLPEQQNNTHVTLPGLSTGQSVATPVGKADLNRTTQNHLSQNPSEAQK